MKLSPKLIEILQLMNGGWELGFDSHQCKWWVQKGKLGCGGDTIHPHGRIKISRLREEGLIANDGKHHFPTTPYFLTEKGKQYVKDLK